MEPKIQGDLTLQGRLRNTADRITPGSGIRLGVAEDYASLNVIYEDNDGVRILSESHTSWCYSGPGLRINMELFGPEYSISINSLQQELNIFLSRFIPTSQSEDFIEKQAAEQGLMPIIPDEASAYG